MKSFLVFYLFVTCSFASGSTIKMLSWWDYQAPEVISKLKKNDYKIDLTIYKSNEVAFSKLVSGGKDYDVIVVSGIIMDSLKKIVKLESLESLRTDRRYSNFLDNDKNVCVPYLWSATVFSVVGSGTATSMQELTDLKKQGYKITIVDEPLEIVARKILDKSCSGKRDNNRINWDFDPKCPNFANEFNDIKSADIKSTTAESLQTNKTAAYGWHGELFPLLDGKLKLNMFLPKNNPVIGADYVCMIGNKSKDRKKEILKFITLLTDKESTTLNMKSTGYFSPYKNHTEGLHPQIKELYNQIVAKSAKNEVVLIDAPSPAIHKKINEIWQKVRYGNK